MGELLEGVLDASEVEERLPYTDLAEENMEGVVFFCGGVEPLLDILLTAGTRKTGDCLSLRRALLPFVVFLFVAVGEVRFGFVAMST